MAEMLRSVIRQHTGLCSRNSFRSAMHFTLLAARTCGEKAHAYDTISRRQCQMDHRGSVKK